jgi:DNA polymerase III subunit beta
MKIITLKENFNNGLNIVNRVVGKNLTLPILNNILITAEKNYLNLSATDLELAISHKFLVKIEKEGKITVPAKVLSGLVGFLPEEKIILEEKGQFLYISCGNHNTKIKGLNADDFPIIPKIESQESVEFNCPDFCSGLAQTVDFCTPNQNRPTLSGVYFNIQKDGIRLVATDGFRLAEKNVVGGTGGSGAFAFVLPQKTAKEIINIFSGREGKLKLVFSPNQVLFESTETQITSRLIEGDYPEYQEIIPKQYHVRIILDKDAFLNQIKTASVFSGRGNEIKLIVNDKREGVEVFSQDPDLGENKSFLEGKSSFDPSAKKEAEIIFNHRFLGEGLTNIKTKNLVLDLNNEENPAVLRPENDPTYLYVVMPIKPM